MLAIMPEMPGGGAWPIFSFAMWMTYSCRACVSALRRTAAVPKLNIARSWPGRVNDLTVVTRNVDDFRYTGVRVLNPFASG
ncbi:hypothetical protein SAMN06295900_102288 [Trinickia caryophylli]|uniref:PIN domain-containing protein n=1 Tax=Trinickia caryophylli TaxID=28094 RepID=A0A1X7D2E6_TRICW|nr:hypothetical protein SAMN06295900_102288 [Trinickia caryophylli]